MKFKTLTVIVTLLQFGPIAPAQVAPPSTPRPAVRPGGSRSASPVDQVIQLAKGGMSEAFIINRLKKSGKTVDLSPADILKLKQAGVSENVINFMMEGGDAPMTASTPTPVPDSGPPAASISAPAAPMAAYNTDLSTLGCVQSPRKRVLAISEFDWGGVRNQIQAIFGTDVDIGKGIMALLTKQLQQDGKYRIVERANLKTLLGEQDTGTSNRVKQGTNAKIGKIIGADAYLMGTIVVFGRDDKKKETNTGGWIPGAGAMGLKFGKKNDKAVVAIAYRLVETETSEILDTAQERGESARESKSFAITGLTKGGAGGIGSDMTSSNFAETIIGEATIACIKNLSQKMSEQAVKVKMRRVEVEGRLADVAGKNLYITAAGNDGVNRCDKFEVSKILREVKDPVTKEVIDLVVDPVGEMLITEVRDKMSVGVYHGSVPPHVNMVVRKVNPPEDAPALPPATTPPPPTTPAAAVKK